MEPVSQVVLRNQQALPDGPLLLVCPPPDDLCTRLLRDGRTVRVSHTDRGDWRRLRAAGVEARFEPVPAPAGDETLAILYLPREKERLSMTLHALADALAPQARVWLVGENRSGIKSAGPHLSLRFACVRSMDKARHCGLYEAYEPRDGARFDLADYASDWSAGHGGREIRMRSFPGVFANGRLDAGSAALLRALEPLRLGGRVLDFACGSGVIGLALKAVQPDLDLVLSDTSAIALEAARQSVGLNGLDARLVASDGLEEVDGRFDWIVSNPPFHRGVRNDYDVAAGFFARAGTFLNENGKMVVVFNRHLPYEPWIRESFPKARVLAREGEYVVACASRR